MVKKKISRFRGIPGFKPTENQKIFRICYAWRFFCCPASPIGSRCRSAIRSIDSGSSCAGSRQGAWLSHLRTTPGPCSGAAGRRLDDVPGHIRVVASFSQGFGTVFIKRRHGMFSMEDHPCKKNDRPNGLSFKSPSGIFFLDFSDHLFRYDPLIELFGCDIAQLYGHLLERGALLVGFLCDFGCLVVSDLRIE